MTPLLLQLVKSAAIVAGAGIILRRFSWREYPALLLLMLWEVLLQTATFGFRAMPSWMLLMQDGICAAAICEVIRESRLRVKLGVQVRVFIGTVAAAKILASIPELTTVQGWYLFRSYFLWAAFFVLAGITIARWREPILERKATRIYRAGLTVWVFVLAASGSFVRGGLGYMIFPRTMHVWNVAHVATCLAISGTVIGMSAAMSLSAPGRKRAAKKPGGKTVCGLIQLERVA